MENLLTVEVVAKRLGITRMGVYGMVFKHQIPVLKISKRCIRFRESDLDSWLAAKAQGIQAPVFSFSAPRSKKNSAAKNSAVDKIVAGAIKEVLF